MPERRAKLLLPKTIIIPRKTELLSAPRKIELANDWYEVLIPIGNDHTAKLLIDEDAIRALNSIEPTAIIF